MFGLGNRNRRQVRNDTFGGSNMRNAAIAGLGMLAWKWWKNRQQPGQQARGTTRSFSDQSYSGTSTRPSDSL